jgi:hypothetical protein
VFQSSVANSLPFKHYRENLTAFPSLASGSFESWELVRLEWDENLRIGSHLPFRASLDAGERGCEKVLGSAFFPAWLILNQTLPQSTLLEYEANEDLLTICCHANIDAFLKATFLALISRDFVYNTFSFIFTGIRWMEIFLNGSSKETLHEKEKPKTTVSCFLKINDSSILCSHIYESNCFGLKPVLAL